MMNSSEKDILVIGAGPAGIQAAIHASRRKASVTVAGKIAKSSLGWAWVENLFCILGEVSGEEMLKKGKKQAERFGVEFIEADAVNMAKEDGFVCGLEDGTTIRCKAIVLSTGITRNKSNIDREKDFIGRGVSYCSDCDGPLYRGKRVAVIGGESAAYVAVENMTEFAEKVYLIDHENKADETRRRSLSEKGVEVLDKTPAEIEGEETVEGLRFEDSSKIDVDGIFIEMGSRSVMELALPLGLLPNEKGFLEVDRSQRTEVEGVFACGDITGPPFQVCKAIGEGCVAGLSAVEYAREQ